MRDSSRDREPTLLELTSLREMRFAAERRAPMPAKASQSTPPEVAFFSAPPPSYDDAVDETETYDTIVTPPLRVRRISLATMAWSLAALSIGAVAALLATTPVPTIALLQRSDAIGVAISSSAIARADAATAAAFASGRSGRAPSSGALSAPPGPLHASASRARAKAVAEAKRHARGHGAHGYRAKTESERLTREADAALARGALREAAAAYQSVLAENATFIPARLGLADATWLIGDREKASALYEELLSDTASSLVPSRVRERREHAAAASTAALEWK